MMSEWQPITTFPYLDLNGALFAAEGGPVFFGEVFLRPENVKNGSVNMWHEDTIVRITHWMPLPEPPKEETE